MERLLHTGQLLDEQLNAVAHVERRRLLCALVDENRQEETPIQIDEVEGVAETQAELAALQHNHLPKLEALGFIRWDHMQVTTGPQFGEIKPLLELLNDRRDELPTE